MDWIKDIDWAKMRDFNPNFKPFLPADYNDPQDPFYAKVSKLQRLLMKRPLWLSDEYRNAQAIEAIIYSYFSGTTFNVFYEVGDFQALIGFMKIHPGFKCEITLKLIDSSLWGADFVRASKELVELFIKELKLKRVSIETADKRISKMAKMAGFVDEGQRPNDLRWDGKFYPKYLLGKYGI